MAGRAAGAASPPGKVVPGARGSRGQVSDIRDLAAGFSTGSGPGTATATGPGIATGPGTGPGTATATGPGPVSARATATGPGIATGRRRAAAPTAIVRAVLVRGPSATIVAHDEKGSPFRSVTHSSGWRKCYRSHQPPSRKTPRGDECYASVVAASRVHRNGPDLRLRTASGPGGASGPEPGA
ncbi:hypothetical protein GCM10011574_70820 [Microbispora bryophytorum]|uniref:Uncharacterized protein n=1 Tax=Microbispora bryophytorum TaxID=1460882 RepID=A0A8H9HBI9_9ACTN|nr:hypothetical protein GCM10011574_70820 [Microbispora bryophytorum]